MTVREHGLPELPHLIESDIENFPSNPHSPCHCSSSSCSSHARNYYKLRQSLYKRYITRSKQLDYTFSRGSYEKRAYDSYADAYKRDLEAIGIDETLLEHFGLLKAIGKEETLPEHFGLSEKKDGGKHHHLKAFKKVCHDIGEAMCDSGAAFN